MEAQCRERERLLLALARVRGMPHERKLGAALALGPEPDPELRLEPNPNPPPHPEPAPAPDLRRLGIARRRLDFQCADEDRARLAACGGRVVGAADPAMPPRLRAIVDCPAVLFVRGDLAALSAPTVAVVGSRRATAAGARIARRLAGELAERGVVVASGLAQGIDAEAHRGALEAGGRTVAVLGSPLDRIYPAVHGKLAERIAGQGALVSEYPFGLRPLRHHFPWRNRIISGLSLGVVVVEAAERSGSLITARLGAEQGREVFAVPGSILNPLAGGCHRLIKDGAKLVERVEDVLEELPAGELLEAAAGALRPEHPASRAERADAPPPAGAEDPERALVLDRLGYEPAGVEALVGRTGLTPERVYSILLQLELGGRVRMDPAGRYARVQ